MRIGWVLALAAIGIALCGAAGGKREATARGGFEIEHHSARASGGVGSITLHVVQDGASTQGDLLFAAEGHSLAQRGAYPHVIVRVPTISVARFSRNRLDLEAHGHFHDLPVRVVAYAIDGGWKSGADYFCIKVYDLDGEMVYQAMGQLTSGDIHIGGAR
jgi:hypothetical protein